MRRLSSFAKSPLIRMQIILLLFSLIAIKASAQNRIGLSPQVSTKFKISNTWEGNSRLGAREIFFQNPFPDNKSEIQFEKVELELVLIKSNGLLSGVGAGYMIRYTDHHFAHQFIQQYSFAKTFTSLQVSHRFRTEQTLEEGKTDKYRLRYRIGLKQSIKSSETGPSNWYLKFNNEYIGSLQKKSGNLEIRALAAIGYNLSPKNQIEAGVDYRARDIIKTKTKHDLWLAVNWQHNF